MANIIDYQVRSWFGESVPSVVSQPAVRALMTKWAQIKADRDPLLADFWHEPDDAFADSTILFLRSNGDYVYLHHGRHLREQIGFSLQGLTLSDFRTRIRAQLVQVYDRTCDEFTPSYFQSFADFMEEVVLWGRLCLPLRLAENDPRVVLLVYCHPSADHSTIFKAVFERSLSSILIAAPVKDGDGKIVDAWIVAQNREATEITGIAEHATGNLLLRSTPLFARDDLWTYLTDRLAAAGSVGARVVSPRRNVTSSIELELVEDYLVIRAAPFDEASAVFTLG